MIDLNMKGKPIKKSICKIDYIKGKISCIIKRQAMGANIYVIDKNICNTYKW